MRPREADAGDDAIAFANQVFDVPLKIGQAAEPVADELTDLFGPERFHPLAAVVHVVAGDIFVELGYLLAVPRIFEVPTYNGLVFRYGHRSLPGSSLLPRQTMRDGTISASALLSFGGTHGHL